MELTDAHCHLDFPEFADYRERVLAVAAAAGVSRIVIPGVRRQHWDRVVRVASGMSGVYYCLGIHPWYVGEHEEGDLAVLERRLSGADRQCVGLGECGLDRLRGELADQIPWFEAQVELAARLMRPLVIHSVRTHDEIHRILRAQAFAGRALIHGFSGSYEQARQLVDLGCYIGVGGVITHGRAKKTRDAIARLPVDALVLETDAPDMAPEGVAKGCNSPEYLPMIFDALVSLKAAKREELASQLLRNSCQLYDWPVPV
ncbi:TatD family hydrolase [Marinobacter sp. M-5]|jgi:TatD DNase family protein|uniref:TatD family hydrolase n=1 Tax=Marinobacter sp. M-5 TaxID=3081089 RepID=UPI00293CF850|nr:TatD family hydrolase [Marinobacter sp. M-5]MDV3505200.1 TatD family hydrolase [Marinobacter sp. M-5]